jgi:hypothetical protein
MSERDPRQVARERAYDKTKRKGTSISARFSDGELAQIDAVAKSRSAFIRESALQRLKRTKR